MTDWDAVLAHDFAVPAGRAVPDLADELCALLASPDPVTRDDVAYSVLAIWTSRGVLDGHLGAVGTQLADRMRQGEICERTFAAMVLSWVILRDARTAELDDQAVHGWLVAFASWWPHEKDLRGWDPELGWLHRVAYALATVLTRTELSGEHATRWLDRVRAAIENGAPGPVPPWAANTLRTLAAVYVFADRAVRWYEPETGALGPAIPLPHAQQVKEAIAATLRLPWRGLG